MSKRELNADAGSVENGQLLLPPCVSMECREAAGWYLALVHDSLFKYFQKKAAEN